MKVTITSRNFNASEHLKDTIEKKIQKLSKYFSEDIVVNVMLSSEKGKDKVEATINAKGTIFRAEETANAAYDAIDRVVEKLSTQMSRYKSKLLKKHKENKEFIFAEIPDVEEEEINIVKRKKIELTPMSMEEAIIQMELLEHNFFVYADMETNEISVVYKRKNDDYGVIETTF
jgi:putative sigma-54 modulation protein